MTANTLSLVLGSAFRPTNTIESLKQLSNLPKRTWMVVASWPVLNLLIAGSFGLMNGTSQGQMWRTSVWALVVQLAGLVSLVIISEVPALVQYPIARALWISVFGYRSEQAAIERALFMQFSFQLILLFPVLLVEHTIINGTNDLLALIVTTMILGLLVDTFYIHSNVGGNYIKFLFLQFVVTTVQALSAIAIGMGLSTLLLAAGVAGLKGIG